MAVTKRTRYEVLRRDNHACRYCGGVAPDVKLTVDHVVPTALGGSDDPGNLVAACWDCNIGKAAGHPDDDTVAQVSHDAVRWATALRTALAAEVQDIRVVEEYRAAFVDAWENWRFNDGEAVVLPSGWRSTVDTWLKLGVPVAVLQHAVTIAMDRQGKIRHRDLFRYMCGVVWRTVDQARERAETGQAVPSPAPLRWSGFRVGPDGCGHCWECLHPEDDDTCRFLAPLADLETDEEPATCDTCGHRNCPWQFAIDDATPDAAYEAHQRGIRWGIRDGVRLARYWQTPILAMFGPPMGTLPTYEPDPNRDPWAPRHTWDDALKVEAS